MSVPSTLNVTVPVGSPAPGGGSGDTVAVIVTDWPKSDGLGAVVTTVLVWPLSTVELAVPVLSPGAMSTAAAPAWTVLVSTVPMGTVAATRTLIVNDGDA